MHCFPPTTTLRVSKTSSQSWASTWQNHPPSNGVRLRLCATSPTPIASHFHHIAKSACFWNAQTRLLHFFPHQIEASKRCERKIASNISTSQGRQRRLLWYLRKPSAPHHTRVTTTRDQRFSRSIITRLRMHRNFPGKPRPGPTIARSRYR